MDYPCVISENWCLLCVILLQGKGREVMVEGPKKSQAENWFKKSHHIIGGKENTSLPSAGSSVAQHLFLSLCGKHPELQAEPPLEESLLP